jgi:predicted metal-binding membrane protein
MSRLTIEASTPLCLLQDAGRFGVRHLGVTQGGARIGVRCPGPTGCWATGWICR